MFWSTETKLPYSSTKQETFGEEIWRHKYRLMTQGYGFGSDSWEARVTPRSEAFWCFHDARAASRWVEQERRQDQEAAT